ncbi:ABC transporter ATP-binding protein [Candidatus Woesearchaeota archaeon]|nr:ABC transporter ATP-binding protein [Candidatus Woesearchaeota archaeon]
MVPLIQFKKVCKSFGDKEIIKNLSLDLFPGEIFGLVGTSGCGKSTLMKLLLGVYPPDSGNILINGEDISNNLTRIRKLVGYTTQENSFYDKLTIYENLKYYANLYNLKQGDEFHQHLNALLHSVGLLEHKNAIAGRISGGMKRRLDFAISLIHNPKILILDEPTTGLDPLLVKQFWEIVKKTKSEDNTMIISSHIFPEIQENADRVGIMHNKHILKIVKPGGKSLFSLFKNIVK